MLPRIEDYYNLAQELALLDETEYKEVCRHLARTDLFFLLFYVCRRADMYKQWLLDRCAEIQKHPDGYLDLWAREHYKSTIITYGKSLQDILASHGDNPLAEWGGHEVTIGIFSCTRPIAKGFLRQIKRELEDNEFLKQLFPDILYEKPGRDAPKWSEDDGLIVKRKSNPKESTIEAWGIVEGQPTSKHFFLMVYDDVVTVENVRSPEMISKTTESWELSINLGALGGKTRMIGTRYHYNDTYKAIMDRQAATPRIYPATLDGSVDGEPSLLEKPYLDEKRRRMGGYTFSCQMLQNPIADDAQGFKRNWLKFYDFNDGGNLNKYILVDAASEKKKTSDFTAMVVIGLGSDRNYYLLDVVRDRLNLTERANMLFHLHKKWKPIGVGYEKYGQMADIEHIKDRMTRENYNFDITQLGGRTPKNDRIRRLIPIVQEGRLYLPRELFKTIYDKTTIELIEEFLIQEYDPFPVGVHDDMLDSMSRILDEEMNTMFPIVYNEIYKDDYAAPQSYNKGSSWSA